jgi:ribonuclease J
LTRVTIYGGLDEIGGNKLLVEDKDTRIVLDFGMSLAARARYFSDPYASPRSKESLLRLGIIPDIKGLYAWERETAVDAVVLSHAHLDHYGYLSMMNRRIPVYCGDTTKSIMEAITETKRSSFETDYSGISYHSFRTGSKIKIGSLTIVPIHVDHSIPGAYGFIVETSSGRLVYTGDLRAHGRASRLTKDFVEAAASERPELLLTEATNIVGGVVSSEEEIERKLTSVIGRASGLSMASFSSVDTDRLQSFHRAAQETEKKLVVTMRQAHLLSKLAKDPGLDLPSLKDESIAIYRRSKKRYEDWEEEVCKKGEVLTSRQIVENQTAYVFVATLSDMESLVEVRPEAGGVYVLSSSEPFNEEMELDMQRLVGWLEFYGMPLYHVHISGHIMPQDLKELVSRVRSRKTVPIHTEHPSLFAKFVASKGQEVTRASYGVPIEVK